MPKFRMPALFAVFVSMTGHAAFAQSTPSKPEPLAVTVPSSSMSSPVNHPASLDPLGPVAHFVPDTHVQVLQRTVRVDGDSATLFRHERRDGRNAGLAGEHFSAVMAADGTLKGFANISLDLAGKPLPSRERSEQVAREFLHELAPDLLPRMQISWIDPHDEPIRVWQDGRSTTVTLTGMKVKARNLADGRWFWVIVGSDEKPMVFERDIVWISFPGHRQTEKWLHDSWLGKQRG